MMARNKCQLRRLPACPWSMCKRTLGSSLSLHSVPQGPWLQIYPNYNFEDPTYPNLVGSPSNIPILSLKSPALGSPSRKSLFLLPVSSNFKLWNLATKRLSMPWKKGFCVIYMAPNTQRMNTYVCATDESQSKALKKLSTWGSSCYIFNLQVPGTSMKPRLTTCPRIFRMTS